MTTIIGSQFAMKQRLLTKAEAYCLLTVIFQLLTSSYRSKVNLVADKTNNINNAL